MVNRSLFIKSHLVARNCNYSREVYSTVSCGRQRPCFEGILNSVNIAKEKQEDGPTRTTPDAEHVQFHPLGPNQRRYLPSSMRDE